jgi:hypothetical protein
MKNSNETKPVKRIVAAPPPSNPNLLQGVINVECYENEEIEWIWTETTEGRFVSGFKIVEKDS